MKNFLKQERHTHKDPEVRIASLDSMDDKSPENQIVIERMASTDSDETVRVAAINSLSTVETLQRVLAAQPSMASTVESRITQLSSENIISEVEAKSLLNEQADVYAPLFAINSANESVRHAALEKLADEALMLNVIEQSRFHDVRLACAKQLKQDDNIKAALLACRSRDKEVARLLQARIDEKTAAIAEQKASNELAQSTLSSMQSLSSSVWSPQYAGRHAALLAKWESVDKSNLPESDRTTAQQQFTAASEKASNTIKEHDEKVAADKIAALGSSTNLPTGSPTKGSQDQPSAIAKHNADKATGTETESSAEKNNGSDKPLAVAKPDPARDALLLSLKTKKLEELDAFEYKESVESGSESEKLLAHAKSVGVLFNPAFDLSKGRPGAISERIKRVKALLNTDSILPGVVLTDCVYMTELNEHASALDNRLEKAKQESLDRAKATHKQFAALSATITDGKWGPASSMFRRLQKKVDAMEPAERGQFADKVSRAEKQLDEMADWQDFAARPKLEVLCNDMEALPAKELKPEALAKEIKTLQAQWKALGASRASNDLWTRFKTAGDTAYEPCKAYFAEKQEQRETKQAAKSALCDQLERQYQSTDWESPDWKEIQRTVNNAKRDWSRNRVSDRKPDRALEQRFSDVLKPFDEKLVEQYDANVLEKQELIEKIKKLAEADINQHSANQAKRLQSAWKQVGIVRRKDDQSLWEEFNSHCKVIYKHQHEQKREKYQASMSHVFRARDIIKELRKLSKTPANKPPEKKQAAGKISDEKESENKAPDSKAAGSRAPESRAPESREQRVQALQSEFQALAEFPEKDKKFLLRDFRGALEACSKMQESASKQRVKAEANEVIRLVELCEQLELAVETPDNKTDTLLDDVKHAWDNSEASVARDTLNRLLERRESALKHLDAGTAYDYDKNEKVRRQLLIEMEILADKETPAEDKALRMQYQLEHLREGMTSSSVVDKRSELAQLVSDWHAAPPTRQAVKDSLHSRFLAASNQ